MTVFEFDLPHQVRPGGVQFRLTLKDKRPQIERKHYGLWERVRSNSLNQALLLMVLRERVARLKAEQHAARLHDQAERSKDIELELAQLRAIQDRLGARGTA